MSRTKRIERTKSKHLHLPEQLVNTVDLLLFDPLEDKVPYGAWQKYLQSLIEQDLELRKASSKLTRGNK